MTNTFKPGDLVTFNNPENEAEAEMIFRVIEDRDTRVLVQPREDGFNKIMPTFVYNKADLKRVWIELK